MNDGIAGANFLSHGEGKVYIMPMARATELYAVYAVALGASRRREEKDDGRMTDGTTFGRT